MSNVNITLRIEEQLKKQAEELFSDFGLSFNAAITMFLKQAVREQRIPFEVTRNNTVISAVADDKVAAVSEQLIRQNLTAYKELAK